VNLITEAGSPLYEEGFDPEYSSSASSRSPTDSSSSSSSDDESHPQTSEAILGVAILYSERFFFLFRIPLPCTLGYRTPLALSVQCTLMCSRCLLVNRVILAAFKFPWPEWPSLL
jgi:hypothetical protein